MLAIFTIQINGANTSLGISVFIASVTWDVEAIQNWFLSKVEAKSFLMSIIPLSNWSKFTIVLEMDTETGKLYKKTGLP